MADEFEFFGESDQGFSAQDNSDEELAYYKNLVDTIDAEIEEAEKTLAEAEAVSREMDELSEDDDLAENRRSMSEQDLAAAKDIVLEVAQMYGIDPEVLHLDMLEQPALDGGEVESNNEPGLSSGKFRNRPSMI